jgi:hypothetical protein
MTLTIAVSMPSQVGAYVVLHVSHRLPELQPETIGIQDNIVYICAILISHTATSISVLG